MYLNKYGEWTAGVCKIKSIVVVESELSAGAGRKYNFNSYLKSNTVCGIFQIYK